LENILSYKKNNKRVEKGAPVTVPGTRVFVRDGDVNAALRKFKKKVQDSGLLQELREREFYTKPTERRKRAKAAGRARHLKKMRNENRSQQR